MDDLDQFATVGPALRHLRKRRGLTQQGVADALRVERPTISMWEADRHLPSRTRARALDDLLDAAGELRQLIEQHREHALGATPTLSGEEADLRSVFRGIKLALEEHMQRDDQGLPLGWAQNLNAPSAPTAVTTAFGIRTLLLIDGTSRADLMNLGQTLRSMAGDDGGWQASAQATSSPEATAMVVDALARVGTTEPVDQLVAKIESQLDDAVWRRAVILTTILEVVGDLQPDCPLTDRLIRGLLSLRSVPASADRVLWGEKSESGLVSPEPTAPHTARSVAVLARARAAGWVRSDLSDEDDDAIGTGLSWLLGQTGGNTAEFIERSAVGGTDATVRGPSGSSASGVFIFRHFTEAWVARALLLAGLPAHHPRVVTALGNVWASYNVEFALWRWGSGDVPIWMTLDAVKALRLAALASMPARRPHRV